mgnify:CR=1 FL=1
MKRNIDFLAGISGLIAQIGNGYGMHVAHGAFHRHWSEILEGAKLAQITVLSLQWMRRSGDWRGLADRRAARFLSSETHSLVDLWHRPPGVPRPHDSDDGTLFPSIDHHHQTDTMIHTAYSRAAASGW